MREMECMYEGERVRVREMECLYEREIVCVRMREKGSALVWGVVREREGEGVKRA